MFDPAQLPYRRGSDLLQTRTRHPRTLPPNFALYCDWIIWDRRHVYTQHQPAPRTVYVRSDIEPLTLFVSENLDTIRSPFALVTTSHDLTMPLGFERQFGFPWRKVVANRFLRVWFTENRDLDHPRIKPLPLGIPCPDLPSWIVAADRSGSVWTPELRRWADSLVRSSRSLKVFGCWYARDGHPSNTCPDGSDERSTAYEYFKSKPDIFEWHPPGMSRADYIEKMAAYPFVLCPHGGGLDPNPRCWEALLLKSIPIVKRNTVTESLQHLPIVVVDDWSEVTIERLREWLNEIGPHLHDDSLEHRMSNRFYFERVSSFL